MSEVASPGVSSEAQPNLAVDTTPDAPESIQTEQAGRSKGQPAQKAKVSYNRSFGAVEIKPIPPKGPETAEDPKGTPLPGRDEQGRFLKRDSTDGLPTETPEPEEAPEEEFEFAGKKWKGRKDAEQNFKSLQGQFKPLKAKAEEAESKAVGWYREAQRLAAELKAAREGQPAPAGKDAKPAAAASQEVKGIDWELYAEIRKAAEEAGKPYEAERWLLEQQEELLSSRHKSDLEKFRKELLDSLQPIQMSHLEQQAIDQIENVREVLGQEVDAQGQPQFPELNDATEAYAIGRTWREAGMPPELALTPQGAAAAVLLYRYLKAGGSPAQETEVSTEEENVAPEAPSPANQARAAMITGGSVARTRGETDMPPEVSRLLSSMKRVGISNKNPYFLED